MISGMLFFVFCILAIVFLFVFGIIGTILGLVFHVTSFGLRVVLKPLLSLILILLVLAVLL